MLIETLKRLLCVGPWLLSGCGEEAASVPIACSGEHSCPPAHSSPFWAVQLWPKDSGDRPGVDPHYLLMPQEGQSLDFDGTGSAVLRFRAVSLLSGLLTTADNRAIPRARVQASLPSAIPGQDDYRFDTQTAEKTAGTYLLRVPTPAKPKEQPYKLWVGFDDVAQAAQYPPLWFSQIVASDVEVPLKLRAQNQLASFSGRIVNALGEGVGGMTIQVFDETNQIVSTSAQSLTATDGTGGTYRVWIDPTLSPKTSSQLRVVVRPSSAQALLPSMMATVPVPDVGTNRQVHFVMPAQRTPVPFMLPLRGLSPSGATEEAKSARVLAQIHLEDATTPAGVQVTYTAQADADAQGVAKLWLVPAPSGGKDLTYRVSVASPPGASYASTVRDVQVGPTEGVLPSLTLPTRARLLGRLLSTNGEPVSSAQVVAQPILPDTTSRDPLERVLEPTKPLTTTDDQGRFGLWLDPGDWDLDFIPVLGTAPRTSLDNVRIQTTDVEVGDVRLPQLSLAKVLVMGPTMQPAPQVKVRVLEIPDVTPRIGVACHKDLPCSKTAKVRAEAFTDSKGRVQFLLPDALPNATMFPK